MINLSSEPSLGSMVITRDAVWKYTYLLPRGMEFPDGSTAWVKVTNRAGAPLGDILDGEVGPHSSSWLVEPDVHNDFPEGANFEMYVELPDEGVFKVRYGRVVRRQPEFPLNPAEHITVTPQMYEDTLGRSAVGPRWVSKHGRIGMHQKTPPPASWAMGVRNSNFFLPLTLWDDAAVLWYAPVAGDTIAVTFSLLPDGDGKTAIILGSNYQMNSYMGVVFDTNGTDDVQAITGTGPIAFTLQATPVVHAISAGGSTYTLKYSLATNKLSLYVGSSLSPLLEWEDTGHTVPHGMGYRYIGASWQGSFVNPGPLLYYWKAIDAV